MIDLICGCSQGGDCTHMSVCQAENFIEEMQERIDVLKSRLGAVHNFANSACKQVGKRDVRIDKLENGLRECRRAVKYTNSYESVTKTVDALLGPE